MEWGKPEILWGLAALIIPVLIHLLHLRRYRKVAFSNVSFLAEVTKETRSRHRLKNLLILLTRLIAVGALVLAFADPFIPFDETEGTDAHSSNVVSIYVDNSPSMQASGENGALLQVAKDRAIEIASEYSETDRFHIVTNGFEGRDSRYLTKEECLERISSIRTEPIARDIISVVTRASDNTSNSTGRNRILYVLSDLQKSTHTLNENFSPDTNLSIHFLPCFANDRPNVWIDSAWFNSPLATAGKPAELHLRLNHNAMKNVEGLSMKLEVNNERKAVGTYNISPGLSTDTVLRFSFTEAGHYHAEISIEDSPIVFDDRYYLGFEVVEKIRVLQIAEDLKSNRASSIERVCHSNRSSIDITSRKSLPDESELQNYDLIISNGVKSPSSGYSNTLVSFAESGGSVLILLDSGEVRVRSSELLEKAGMGSEFSWQTTEIPTSLRSLNVEHPLFESVFSSAPKRMDLPKATKALNFRASPEVERLGTNFEGSHFISKTHLGSGAVYLLGTPLEEELGNLTAHALFVPMILRIVETSRQSELKSITLGKDDAISIRKEASANSSIRIMSTDSTTSIIPEARTISGSTRLLLGPSLTLPGNYMVHLNSDLSATFGVNANRIESDPTSWDIPNFENELNRFDWVNADVLDANEDTLGSLIENIESGNHLWWYLVFVVILALTGETLLQKRWKAAS
jgi:hypothetical protein